MNKVRNKKGKFTVTHNLSRSKFYFIWQGIKNRCCNIKDKQSFCRYGKTGIEISKDWMKFENFRDDMYDSYLKHVKENSESNTSIDRIDNDGNYCKENCRWATMKIQANNRSNNHMIAYLGRTMTVTQWANKIGINHTTLDARINKYKWSIKKSLTFNI